MTGFEAFVMGERMDYGCHTFLPEDIIAFAKKFDPQPFHIDVEAAKKSLFGALCASGWHTAAVWMKKNQEYRPIWEARLKAEGKTFPELGPSPGFRDMKWPGPVFAGDTVHYYNTVIAARRLKSKPLWGIVETRSEGINQHGKTVITFDSGVLFKL
jgi:acyl dehydratase